MSVEMVTVAVLRRSCVGWVERSETHQPWSETHRQLFPAARLLMGFAPLNPSYMAFLSQPEHVQHRGVALLLDLRRVDQRAPAGGVEAGRDGDVLLPVDLECHRRGVEAGADVELPQFLKRGVVIRRDG